MSGPDDPLAGLRSSARVVLGRVEGLEGRWRSGTLDETELDELARAVWRLRVDLESRVGVAAPTAGEDTATLVRIREGIDAAIAIVVGLLQGSGALAPPDGGSRS